MEEFEMTQTELILFLETLAENVELKANTGEQPVRLYRNKETGELFTYLEMLEEWRERYEGINPDNGLYQYHWHTRYDYLG